MVSNKIRVTVSIEKYLMAWADSEIKRKNFANRTHCIEKAMYLMKEQFEK